MNGLFIILLALSLASVASAQSRYKLQNHQTKSSNVTNSGSLQGSSIPSMPNVPGLPSNFNFQDLQAMNFQQFLGGATGPTPPAAMGGIDLQSIQKQVDCIQAAGDHIKAIAQDGQACFDQLDLASLQGSQTSLSSAQQDQIQNCVSKIQPLQNSQSLFSSCIPAK